MVKSHDIDPSAMHFDPESFSMKALFFEAMMNDSDDSIYFKDRNLHFIYVNKNKASRHGIDHPSKMAGKTDFDFLSKEVAEVIAKGEEEIIRTGTSITGIIEKLRRIDGETTWASCSKYPLYDRNDNIIGVWGISRDMTEYERAKEALNQSEARYRALIENISDVIVVTDSDGVITYASPNFAHSFGWQSCRLIGKEFPSLIHPGDVGKSSGSQKDIFGQLTGRQPPEYRFRHANGQYRPVELNARDCLADRYIRGILISFRDISERKKKEKRIVYLNHHDILTGLYNRTYFNDAQKRLDHPSCFPLTFMIGDMNGLKAVNDLYGHAEGDRLLIETAKILKKCCRRSDVIARLDGDEFYFLMPKTGAGEAMEMIRTIRRECKIKRYPSRNGHFLITPSISLGFACKETVSQDLQTLMRSAESMMYRQKHAINPEETRPY